MMKRFVRTKIFNSHPVEYSTASDKELRAVLLLQRAFRNKFYVFEKKKLIDRLVVELNFISTSARYYLFLLLFVSVMFMLFSVFDGYASTVAGGIWQQFPNAYDRDSFLSNYTAVIGGTHLTQSLVNSVPLSASASTLTLRSDCAGITFTGFMADLTNPKLITSDCMEWTAQGVNLNGQLFEFNLLPGPVGLVLTQSTLSVYSGGDLVSSGQFSNGLKSCFASNLQATSGRLWSAYDEPYDAAEMANYLAVYGIPKLFLLTATTPGTSRIEFFDQRVFPPFFFISSGVLVQNNFEIISSVFSIVASMTPLGGVWTSRVVQPFLGVSEGISRLGILEVDYDEKGFSNSRIFFYPKTNSSVSLLIWFVVNIVVSVIIGYWDISHFRNSFKIKNQLALIPNLVFSIFFYAYFGPDSAQDALVTQLVNASSASEILEIVDGQIIPRFEMGKSLAFFGGMFVLYLILWRLVACMRVHPRVALFVNTMTAASSEIFHYLVTFFIVLLGLAMIGVFTFDYSDDAFTSLGGAVYQLFQIMLGDDWVGIGNWRASRLGIVYCVVVPVFLIFNLLNFLLAIVIDTYVKIRKETVEKNNSHQSLLIEVLDIPKSALMFWAFGFPKREVLIEELEQFNTKHVSMKTLNRFLGTNETNFCQFYHGFEFLKIKQKHQEHYQGKHWVEVDDADAVDADVEMQFKIITKELNELLVALHLKQKPASTRHIHNSLRETIIEDYQAARIVERLTKTQVRSRKLREYFTRAKKDAKDIKSNTSSAARNIFPSLLVRVSQPVSNTNSIKASFTKRASTSSISKKN